VGLGSLPERFMGKQIVVCRLPVDVLPVGFAGFAFFTSPLTGL
jgi:hypothetical protein